MNQEVRLWNEIFQIVKENCATDYAEENPQDDLMEILHSEEDQNTYLRQYNEYVERYQANKDRLLQLNTERSARIVRSVAF